MPLSVKGDLNNNGQIDSGDTVTFEYIIKNPTSNSYPFATLETNIDKSLISYISNVYGSVNLSHDNNTITIPNLRIQPGQQLVIRFDATTTFFSQDGLSLSTEPKLLMKDKQLLKQAAKLEKKIKAKKTQGGASMIVKKIKNNE